MKQLFCMLSRDWFLGLSLGAVAFINVFVLLNQSEFLCSWDAYYYLIQVRAIIEEGSMHSTDYSLIYPYLTILEYLINDYVLSYKVGNALLAFIFGLTLYYCIRNLINVKEIAFFMVLFTLISPVISYLIIQFPKNFMGLAGLLFLMGALIQKNYKFVFMAFLICVFSHRLSLVLGAVLLFFMLISKRFLLKSLLLLFAAGLLIIIFPISINIYDIERFKGLFGSHMQYVPFSFYRLIHQGEPNWYWLSYIITESLLLIVSFIYIIKAKHYVGREKYYLSLSFMAVLMLFPMYNITFDGPAVRFYLSYIVFFPLWIAPLFAIIPLRLIRYGILFLLMGVFCSNILFKSENYAPPYVEYHKVTKNIISYANLEQYKLLVMHKGIAEYFTYSTKIDALPWQPEPEVPMDSILRITHKLEWIDFRRNLPTDSLTLIKKVGVQYYILPERLYQQFVYNANFNKDTLALDLIYSNDNPYRLRPKFVKRS